jgi:hypothetical protein
LNSKRRKKLFTPINLPVSAGYLLPASRRTMVLFGSGIGAVILLYFSFDTIFQKSHFISTGAISSNHANFETDCAACHQPGNSVADARCSSCHEKTSALMIYDFESHYLYRSNDFQRTSHDTLQKYHARELPCRSCHLEHRGRDAIITDVPDSKCLSCHPYGSFNKKHPEFEFARAQSPDDSTLKMTHLRHTVFVLQQMKGMEQIEPLFKTLKAETMDFVHFYEAACLYCHNPEPDGKNFKDIHFDKHCAQCHLKADAVALGLPKFDPANPNAPGVETLRQMQQRGGPGLSWAFAANPNLVSDQDGEVSKNPVVHKDPWILENLKRIRKKLYPAEGLFDLLNSAGPISQPRADSLYSEAINALQVYANELQNRSELKGEINKINALLNAARQRLELPSPKRTAAPFEFPLANLNRGLSESQRAGFLQLAFDLTRADGPECQKCHVVENASIRRLQADQDVLMRAEFNHRAHILNNRCTECHTAIPMNEKQLRFSVERFSEFEQALPKTFKADRAATQNIPTIRACQTCHSENKISNRCVACHQFHPNKERRAQLQLFLNN